MMIDSIASARTPSGGDRTARGGEKPSLRRRRGGHPGLPCRAAVASVIIGSELIQPGAPLRPSDIHRQRHAAILAARPEVRELSGSCPRVVALVAALVAVQCAAAVAVAHWPLAYAVATAVLFGAFVAHFLNGCIHEAAHNLILSGSARNKAVAILANLPSVAPSAVAFRHYHLLHHGFHGEPGMDADLPLGWEVKLVGSSSWRKLLWLAFLPLFYGVFHPVVVRKRLPVDRWLVANVVVVVGFAGAMLAVFGWSSFAVSGRLDLFSPSAFIRPAPTILRTEHQVISPARTMKPRPITGRSTQPPSISANTWSTIIFPACRVCAWAG